ncbi:MAG TPA: YetF domain-containing protein [Gemmatimonadales bacterium]|nr:YetF domain-containing protein [Gemmatimonadales bacterium]
MSPFWHDLLIPGVSLGEKIIRPILIYIFLIVGLRLAGKRELAQLNPFDLVVLLTLSNTVQNAIIGDDNSVLGGMIGAATLLVINYFVIVIRYRNQKLGVIIEGGPDILIEKGHINMHNLEAEKITIEELEAAARKQGFRSLKEVDQAILYPGGTFCFIGRVPSADALHHRQIMKELHDLRRELAELRAG